MAIINLTPDSFSNDGMSNLPKSQILNNIEKVLNCKPDIIDIGGESSRPGSKPISFDQEWTRISPCIKYLANIKNKLMLPLISIDTTKYEIIQKASKLIKIDIINNISSEVSKEMVNTAKQLDAKLVVMHNSALEVDFSIKNIPRYSRPNQSDFFKQFINEAKQQIHLVLGYGLAKNKIIFDPGLGFGKSLDQNIELIKRVKQIKNILPYPILLGASRKSFLKLISNTTNNQNENNTSKTLPASLAVLAYAYFNNVDILRLHDINESQQFQRVLSKFFEK